MWVFPADRALDQPMRRDTITHAWIRLRDAHGFDGVRLHDLRHLMASRMLAAGVDVRTVANRLGDANPSTTLRVYAHLIPEADRAAADELGALLDRPAGGGSNVSVILAGGGVMCVPLAPSRSPGNAARTRDLR